MKKLLLPFLLISVLTHAQERQSRNPDPMNSWYGMSAYEFIFSFGEVSNDGQILDKTLRFTPVFNPQSQRHFNFSKHLGLYTGIGMRNVGFINKLYLNDTEIKIKQRAYSAGIPLAIKFGGMERGNYIAIGAEAEWMFHYKEKIFNGDETSKRTSWFSSDINQFNPSLFADIRFHNGTFFRFRYYLNDFLKNKDMSFYLPGTGEYVSYHPIKSTLFYFSIGTAIKIKKKHRLTQKEV